METLGFVEWQDAFPIDNIPSTIEDQSFHISFETVSVATGDQQTYRFSVPFVIRVLRRGFRYPIEAIDSCLVDADSINASLLAPVWRLGLANDVKNIVPTRIDLEPLSSSNDNVVVLNMRFEAFLISSF
jgi:hypothetical protein